MSFGKRKTYSRFRYKSIEAAAERESIDIGSSSGSGSGGGASPYQSVSDLPLVGLTAGQMAFDEENNRLFISNGSGWYKITLINTNPTITANLESVSLGASSNTVLVGYTYNEPEGTPVTVTISNTSITESQGNIVHYTANNTLEINNFAAEGSEWTANVIITVSDGENVGVDSFTIKILYAPDPGGVLFTNVGSNSWTIPEGVQSFSAVAVGGGGGGVSFNGSGGSGGGGGALAYINEYPCTPGEVWTVFVGDGGRRQTNVAGSAGGDSYIEDTTSTKVLHAGGGIGGRTPYSFTPNAPGGAVLVGDGGGAGGMGGGRGSSADAGGGGGAGGYSGAGGNGEGYNIAGNPGTGGGGGGGGAGGSSDAAGAGGGVGLYGEGTSGSGGSYSGGNAGPGGGGSGGANGSSPTGGTAVPSTGGNYGGGGGGSELANEHGSGGQGAVRIIWGADRSFPSTNVGDSINLTDGTAETTV